MVKHAVWPPPSSWNAQTFRTGPGFTQIGHVVYVWDGTRGYIRKEGINMIPKEEEASPQETATAVLIFEDDDKVQERVVEAINKLFFAPPSATGKRNAAHENLESLFEALIKSQAAASPAFRKLIVDAFKQQIESALADLRTEAIQKLVYGAVAKEMGKNMAQLDKHFRRQQAVPKGPRR